MEIFPSSDFNIEWGPEAKAPEWASVTWEPRKRAIRVTSLSELDVALQQKLEELMLASEEEESNFRLFDEEPSIDYDPDTKRQSLSAVIFYG